MKIQPPALAFTALGATQTRANLSLVDGLKLHGDGADLAIEKTFHFPNDLQTMAFAKAVECVAESANHHPDLLIQDQRCTVCWNRPDIQGLATADFACADKVDALLTPQPAQS